MADTRLRDAEKAYLTEPSEENRKRWEHLKSQTGDSQYPAYVQISASQLENFCAKRTGCRRRWYFSSHLYLPEPLQKKFAFGTVIHAVAERWLKADRTGRDPETGKPVDLYPEGWETERDKRSKEEMTLEPREAKLVRGLVSKAIEEGVLEREPGRRVEHAFKFKVCEVRNPDDTVCEVYVKGFIDLLLRGGVEDHKSTKNLNYAKSANALRQSIQMLLYGKVLLREYEEKGEEPPEVVSLCHNYFVKDFDNPRLRKVVTQVPRNEIEDFWAEIVIPAAREMVFTKRVSEWKQIPPPESTAGACNAFGGCKFRSICSGSESVARYKTRIQSLQTSRGLARIDNTAENPKEAVVAFKSLEERLNEAAAKKARIKNGAAKTVPPAKERAVNPPRTKEADNYEEAEQKAKGTQAPWGQDDCTACEGSGMNSKGNPCRVCVAEAPGKFHPSNYERGVLANGDVVWTKNGETTTTPLPVGEVTSKTVDRESTPPAPAPVKKKTSTKKKATKKVEEPDEAEEPTPEPAPVAPKKLAPKAKPSKPVASGPVEGLVLCFGCRPVGLETVELAALLMSFGDKLAAKKKEETYYHLHAFNRRDWLAQAVPKIAARHLADTVIVVPRNPTPDLEFFATALLPFASQVYRSE